MLSVSADLISNSKPAAYINLKKLCLLIRLKCLSNMSLTPRLKLENKKTLVISLKKNNPLIIKHGNEEMEITFLQKNGRFRARVLIQAPESFHLVRTQAKRMHPMYEDKDGI